MKLRHGKFIYCDCMKCCPQPSGYGEKPFSSIQAISVSVYWFDPEIQNTDNTNTANTYDRA